MTTGSSIIQQLAACIQNNGEDKTLELLKDATGNGQQATVNFCINTVSQALKVPAKLFATLERKDERVVGIAFCVYFLNENYNIVFKDLPRKLGFGIGTRALQRYKKIITDAKLSKPKSNLDKLIAEHIDTLQTAFINHKNQSPQ